MRASEHQRLRILTHLQRKASVGATALRITKSKCNVAFHVFSKVLLEAELWRGTEPKEVFERGSHIHKTRILMNLRRSREWVEESNESE